MLRGHAWKVLSRDRAGFRADTERRCLVATWCPMTCQGILRYGRSHLPLHSTLVFEHRSAEGDVEELDSKGVWGQWSTEPEPYYP